MIALCDFDDLAEPGAKGPFTVGGQRIFVVRKDDRVYAYVDSCTHVGAPLEMDEDKFLDSDASTILCSVHGARFDIETGTCLMGPCRNKGLTTYPVHVLNGVVMAESPPEGI